MQGGRTPADTQLQPPIAQDVGNGRLLGYLHRVVQRQQGHRRAKPDAARSLCRGGQYRQWIGEDRERPAEMELSEPHRIKSEIVANLDLRDDGAIALTLGISGRTRQLVEKAEAHS